MNAPVAVNHEHDAIERALDVQLGLTPPPQKPQRERAWDCLAGDVELVCGHPRIDAVQLDGFEQVVCLGCGHEWRTVYGSEL